MPLRKFSLLFDSMPRHNKTIPHKPPLPPISCAKKRRYISEKDALEVAAYQMTLKPEVELGIYRCMHCGGWHLTSINKK